MTGVGNKAGRSAKPDNRAGVGIVHRRGVLTGLAAVFAGASQISRAVADVGTEGWWDKQLQGPPGTAPSAPPAPKPLPLRRLAAPDFDALHDETRFAAAVRPHRDGGMRLGFGRGVETATGRKPVIHNYGHGGGGLSLAFGCAETVRDLVARSFADKPLPHSVAVLGSGVIGMTTALALVERFPDLAVTIYAREIDPKQTSSYWSGGQFAPAGNLVEYQSSEELALLRRHLDLSERRFQALVTAGRAGRYGIVKRIGYSLAGGANTRLDFGRKSVAARSYNSWLIDPTRLLPALLEDLAARRVSIVQREIANLGDISALDETVVVNCLGAGAGPLLDDQAMRPCRGHLVLLKNTVKLDYFLHNWCDDARVNHVFARHDDIVLGGSIQWEPTGTLFDADNPADVRICERILRTARAFYEETGPPRC